jgi:PAS domain S-box-containing protein
MTEKLPFSFVPSSSCTSPMTKSHTSELAADTASLAAASIPAELDALRESEARFRATFERAPVGLAHIGIGGEWLAVNARLCELLSYSREELLATRFQALTHPDDLAADLDHALRLVAGEVASYTMPKRYVRKDGTVVWARLTGSLVRDVAGAPFHFLAVIDEITGPELDRLRAAAAGTERLAVALTAAHDGAYDWDVPSGAVHYSAEWCRMLGYAPEDIAPHYTAWETRVHPEDLASALAALQAHLDGRTARYESEHRLRRKDGTWAWVLSRGQVLTRDADGRPLRMVGTHKDITARRERAAALAASAEVMRRQLAELEAVYGGAPVGLGFVGADLRYVRVNARLAALNGVPPDEHVGRTPSEITPSLAPAIEPLLRGVLATREPVRGLEFRAEAPGEPGAVRDWMIDYYPAVDSDGRVVGVTCAVAEITALKRAQAAAGAALRREARLLAQMHEAVIVTDLAGVIVSWNTGAERLYGYRAADIIGRSVALLYFEEDRANVEATVLAPLRQTGAVALDLRNRRADGTECWIRLSLALVRDAAGVPEGMVGYSTDISDRVRAEAARDALLAREEAAHAAADAARAEAEMARVVAEAARARAEEADRTKSAFVATMSHELRTPLNAIGGHVQLLEMGIHGPVTDAQRDALRRVDQAQRHLLRLINDVLNLARLEANGVSYDMREVVLAEVIADLDALVGPQTVEKGLELVVNVDPACVVRADRDKLLQVLLNLVANAIKFTPVGGVVSIECPTRATGGDDPNVVYLRVRDTGIGISPDLLERVFDPFVQVDTSPAGRVTGTGLGLAISRDLARGMGGDIRARSTPRVGSTFTVTLLRAGS